MKLKVFSLVLSILLLVSLESLNAKPIPENRFKLAYNRTFSGFEKDVNDNTKWSGNFTFIQSADTQFGLIQYFDTNFTKSDLWKEDLALLNEAIKEWNSLLPVPKFVTICGDLVNEYPGAGNNRSKRRAQLDDLKPALLKLRTEIPLVLLGGNHDFLNTPTSESIKEYTEEFGDDYYSFWVGGVMFVVLNAQLYKDGTEVKVAYEAQDEWLDKQLEDAKAGNYAHVVVLQHVPWFLHDVDEKYDPMWTIAVAERKRVLTKLYDAKVRYIFAGHYHRNAFGKYQELEMVTSSAIGAQSFEGKNAESGYRLVEVTREKLIHNWVNITRSVSGGAHAQERPNFVWSLTMSGIMFAYLRLFSF